MEQQTAKAAAFFSEDRRNATLFFLRIQWNDWIVNITLLVLQIVQHDNTPDVRVCIDHLAENVLYLFHNVILSCLVNNVCGRGEPHGRPQS